MPSTKIRNSHTSRHSGLSCYYPFGMQMQGREFAGGMGYRWGFNGKEEDVETYRGCIAFELRIFNSSIGRFLSLDPRMSEYAWQTPFAYYKNSPIHELDALGAGEGDYYNVSGEYLGNDGQDDKRTYLAENKNSDGSFKNAVELKYNSMSISKEDLHRFANTIVEESSGNQKESYGIASSILNQGKDYPGKTLLEILQGKGKGSIYGYKNNTQYTQAEYSMEAAINALSGGVDVTYGATLWDGFDFCRGWEHPKAKNHGINVSLNHYNLFVNYWTMDKLSAASGGKYKAIDANFRIIKDANSTYFQATTAHITWRGQVVNNPDYKKVRYSSTAVLGGTIFWKYNTTFIVNQVDLNK
jgi:RHS repeat-associated protein